MSSSALWLLLADVIDLLRRGKNTLSVLAIRHINHLVSHACFAGSSLLRDVNLRAGVFTLTYCQ